MFNVEPHRYIATVFGTWFLFTMLAVFSIGVLPKLLAVPMGIFVIWLTCWCIDCAYRTERFSKYATLRLFTNLGLAPGFAFLMVMIAAHKQFKLSPIISLMLGCIPLLLATIIYVTLYLWRSSKNSLAVKMTRVEVSEPPQKNRWALGALGAASGGLFYPVFRTYSSPSSLLALLFITISLFMLMYHHTSISSLRRLKEQECKANEAYKFMAVEEIRMRRSASWIGRIFGNRVE